MTAQERKERPLYSGVLKYFPDALLEVAHCSFVGNEQHNPEQPLHWDRSKSTDEADACVRHLLEAGTRDTDGVRHAAKAAWRALALLQKEIEAERVDRETVGVPCYAHTCRARATRSLTHRFTKTVLFACDEHPRDPQELETFSVTPL